MYTIFDNVHPLFADTHTLFLLTWMADDDGDGQLLQGGDCPDGRCRGASRVSEFFPLGMFVTELLGVLVSEFFPLGVLATIARAVSVVLSVLVHTICSSVCGTLCESLCGTVCHSV